MNFRCLNNKVVFKFVEDIANGAFKNKTDWGFQLKQDPAGDIKKPRWGLVEKIGPDVTLVKEGEYVLIEPLMWTLKLIYEGDEFWYTNEEKILAHSEELPDGIQ